MTDNPVTTCPVRLLLIDDERVFTAALGKRLARRHIEATQAFSGREGLRALRKSEFDAVVLDLKMQDMDGLEVLKIIKILAPEIPVIMLSGHASDETALKGIEAGAFDYLTKPYDLDALIQKIGEAMRAGTAARDG